jgi:ketosteroid isomerase-like protein
MNSDTAGQVLAKEKQRGDALLGADMDALSALLSDRLVFAHANATYDDKASLLKKMGSGTIVYKTLDVSEQKVIDLGDTALLISRLTADVTVGDQPRSIDNWTLSVWTREDGDWRLIAYQPTGIPK